MTTPGTAGNALVSPTDPLLALSSDPLGVLSPLTGTRAGLPGGVAAEIIFRGGFPGGVAAEFGFTGKIGGVGLGENVGLPDFGGGAGFSGFSGLVGGSSVWILGWIEGFSFSLPMPW